MYHGEEGDLYILLLHILKVPTNSVAFIWWRYPEKKEIPLIKWKVLIKIIFLNFTYYENILYVAEIRPSTKQVS